ncbi:MAG TPA: permease [Isosphaeraceae bacterium]|jgi:ABC-2 type transport system permease protein|nr:permease [Isosphaeraceae bacterium]
MNAFFVMIRKQLAESKWFLGVATVLLFGLGWLGVFMTVKIEARMRDRDPAGGLRRMAFRNFGGSAMDFSSTAIEVMLWNHPFIMLPLIVWAIARASGAPAGEVAKGTADLTLSRPVSRASYLGAQVVVSTLGLAVLAGALLLGNRVGSQFNTVETPPNWVSLARTAGNLAALGVAIYGFTLIFSAVDSVQWRPSLIGSGFALISFILFVISNIPSLDDWKWLEHYSIFKAYQPVEVAVTGETLAFNASVLCAIGLIGIVLSFLAFQWRDIPSNS